MDSPYDVIYRPAMHHPSRSHLVVMLCVMIGHFRWHSMVRQIVGVSHILTNVLSVCDFDVYPLLI